MNLIVKDLEFCYTSRTILNKISLELHPREMLGVIGPSRMAYERVIPVVEATAAVLGAALSQDA